MASIILKDIIKVYDKKVVAVNDVSLEIKDGEFMVFVGPSGCGKSTLLRMIAGLEDITYGELYIDNVLSNAILPKDRDIAMVFQSYALYPTLTVYDNIAFGIQARKLDKYEIDKRVRDAAEMLGLTEYLFRKPLTLSGGQRQRVALGRAIVRNPKVFLLDEPLSNLDAKLRGQMRANISGIHKQLNTTFVYVTHDQTEAMTMADRICVINKGQIQQVGTPKEIFDKPANVFIATFIGQPSMNIVHSRVLNGVIEKFNYDISKNTSIKYDKNEIIVGIRPTSVKIVKDDHLPKYEIVHTELLGAEQNIFVSIDNENFIIQTGVETEYKVGDFISLKLDDKELSLFDIDSQQRI